MFANSASPAGSDRWFSRFVVIGGLCAIALLFAATALRGVTTDGHVSHDDRPVQLDR